MTYVPTNPYDVPPYQVESLITSVMENDSRRSDTSFAQVRCAQALGMWTACALQIIMCDTSVCRVGNLCRMFKRRASSIYPAGR